MKNIDELKQILDNIEIQVQKCKVILEGGTITPTSKRDFSKKASKVGEETKKGNERII